MIPANRRALLNAALGYTEQSPQFRIIPVDPTRKLPLIKTGTDHAEGASTDPATIEHLDHAPLPRLRDRGRDRRRERRHRDRRGPQARR